MWLLKVQPIPLGVTFSNAVSKAQSSKLERLFSLKCGKRDLRALSFELSKMSLQVGLAVRAAYFLLTSSSFEFFRTFCVVNGTPFFCYWAQIF